MDISYGWQGAKQNVSPIHPGAPSSILYTWLEGSLLLVSDQQRKTGDIVWIEQTREVLHSKTGGVMDFHSPNLGIGELII